MRKNRPSLFLLTALALGWAWDLLFYGRALGVSVPFFVLLFLGALFALGRLVGVRPERRNLWLIAPLLFFATMVFVRADSFLTLFNVTASLMLLGLLAHFFSGGRVERLGLIGYPLVIVQIATDALIRPTSLVSASVNLKAARERGGRNLASVARGGLLAVPVLATLTCFLASADLVFANYISDLIHLEFLSDLTGWILRGTMIGAVAWIVAGGLAYATRPFRASADKLALEKAFDSLCQTTRLGFIEMTTVLTLVNLLFLVFGWIQFTYLFGGQANITLEGYTYAQYARRGFFELLAVSVLTLGLILALHQATRRDTAQQESIFTALSSWMVLFVLVILASAFQRLLLYTDAFGYTQLRLYSHVFIVWLGFVFLWFLIVLWLRSERFAIGALVAALGFLITLNLINPDDFVAEQNLARYRATGKLDIHYLTTLSDDVVPALVRWRGHLSSDDRQILDAHLRHRLERMKGDARWRAWPSFHLARQRAYDVLIESQQE